MAANLALQRIGLPSTAGECSDAVTLDGAEGVFLGPCLEMLPSALLADGLLLDTTAAEFAKLSSETAEESGAGALEVKRRCRWRATDL